MKRLFALLLVGVVVLALVGCSDKKEDKPDNNLVGIWEIEVEGVTYYYDFKNDSKLSVYVDSYTLEMNYTAENSEDSTSLNITLPSADFGAVGVLQPDTEGEFKITEGTYDEHNRVGELKYADDNAFTFTEVEDAGPKQAKVPEDYNADEKLLDTWVNNYSSDEAKQTVTFNDDGTMFLLETYDNHGTTLSIKRDCTYTAQDGVMTLNYVSGEETSLPIDYTVDGDSLNFGGMLFTREGVEIPTQAVEETVAQTTETE